MLLCLRVCAALLKDGLGIGLNRQEEAEQVATELLIAEAFWFEFEWNPRNEFVLL